MKNFVIYRCLPLKEWHNTFDLTRSEWQPGGYKDNCDCPYGSHMDPRYLDHKDPLHLNEILSLKSGARLLTFCNCHEMEHVAYHTFEKIEFLSDFMRLVFKENVATFGLNNEQFSAVRWIAVIDDTDVMKPFGFDGGMDAFILKLSIITGVPVENVLRQIKELKDAPIPLGLKISVKEITEDAKMTGALASIFWK